MASAQSEEEGTTIMGHLGSAEVQLENLVTNLRGELSIPLYVFCWPCLSSILRGKVEN